jgi:UDP-2,4-diacetamido-2,4,6-trideoxy-beta-L-altropyranose hydrolase
MRVFFRVDASSEIGSGHVIRCLTLAKELGSRGAECVFIMRQHFGHMLSRISSEGFKTMSLPLANEPCRTNAQSTESPYELWLGSCWQDDANQVKACIGETECDLLIVDHYGIDFRWETMLRSNCKQLFVIDDLANRSHNCDLLLDQNLVGGSTDRYRTQVSDNCTMLLGPYYALLQQEYVTARQSLSRKKTFRNVLVYFGAVDSNNLTGQVISAFLLLDKSDLRLKVVTSSLNPSLDMIKKQVYKHPRISLFTELSSLAPLMLEADIAVGASGATSWERCCMGLPSLVVSLAENQVEIAKELDRIGLARWLGSKEDMSMEVFKAALLEALSMNDTAVAAWSNSCLQVVDGFGTARVADVLMLNKDAALKVRLAIPEDKFLILNWANDRNVRENAFNQKKIGVEEHHKWFDAQLKDQDGSRLYIIQTVSGNTSVGQVRIDKLNDNQWEIHYSLDFKFRGRGMAQPMLMAALKFFQAGMTKKNIDLIARVKNDNIPSHKIFNTLGFRKISSGEYSTYRISAYEINSRRLS